MPSCRGITLCVISGLDSKVYPEFIHPETPRFRQANSSTAPYHNCDITSLPAQERLGSATPSSSPCIDSYASVYIPSLSEGNRFVIQYCINPPHTDGRNYFFKLLMNGRHISSWGVDPRIMPVGKAMLGLFEPDKKVKSKALISSPVEIKPFYFKEQKRNISAAENGGVIEIKAFRACGRRRRGAILDAFRGQSSYGIEFKSAGLLEKSKNKYFDWLLEDPKDEPYATFRFHYRSWDSLAALQLIPEDCNRKLLPALSTNYGLGTPTSFQDKAIPTNFQPRLALNKATTSIMLDDRTNSVATLSTKDIENTIFGQMVARDTARSATRPKNMSPQSNAKDKARKSYRIPVSTFSISSSRKPMSRMTLQYDTRPLPELPTPKPHARIIPASSGTFSITSSLRSWVEKERSESPEPVVGIAAEIQVLHSPELNNFGPQKSIFDHDCSTSSTDDYNDTCSEVDKSFLSSLSAPPTFSNNASPIKKPTTLGLTLPAGAIFSPPPIRRNRMPRILFQGEIADCDSRRKLYEVDHEDLNSYHDQNRSDLSSNKKPLQVPPQLLAINAGFNFEFDNPCIAKGGKE